MIDDGAELMLEISTKELLIPVMQRKVNKKKECRNDAYYCRHNSGYQLDAIHRGLQGAENAKSIKT